MTRAWSQREDRSTGERVHDMKQIGKYFIGLLAVWTLSAGLCVRAAEDSVVLQGKENQAAAPLELADHIMGDGQK